MKTNKLMDKIRKSTPADTNKQVDLCVAIANRVFDNINPSNEDLYILGILVLKGEKEFLKFGIFLTLESWRIKADFFPVSNSSIKKFFSI